MLRWAREIWHGASLVLVAMIAAGSGTAQARLWDRGGGLIYDEVLDVTWLSDANYFKTHAEAHEELVTAIISRVPRVANHTLAPEDFRPESGHMTWWGAMAWGQYLTYHDTVRDRMLSGWRLPTALNRDQSGPCKDFCDDSEFGYMYYHHLGASPWGGMLAGTNIHHVDLFENLDSLGFWLREEFAPDSVSAWGFANLPIASAGLQSWSVKWDYRHAWLVRPGDVEILTAPPSPRLSVELTDDEIVLSWPSSATGYGLERSSSPVGAQWEPVAGTPIPAGDHSELAVQVGDATSFFRLRKL
jgi:hypothetical protein